MTDSKNEMTVDQWLAIRKDEGLKIDPATAEVDWTYAHVLDPYGVDPDLPAVSVSDGHILPADPAVMFGLSLATCQRRRARRYGTDMNPNWPFLPD